MSSSHWWIWSCKPQFSEGLMACPQNSGSAAEILRRTKRQLLRARIKALSSSAAISDADGWDRFGTEMRDGSIPINSIFSGMNIHKSQLFWCELQGYQGFAPLPRRVPCCGEGFWARPLETLSGYLPLVNKQKAIETGPVEIVDLAINSMVIFHSHVNVYQRGSWIINHVWFIFNWRSRGKPPFSYGFPMVFPLKPPFSYGFFLTWQTLVDIFWLFNIAMENHHF